MGSSEHHSPRRRQFSVLEKRIMYHKFQRKIPDVGGRLSPWVDEEELKNIEKEREVNNSTPGQTEEGAATEDPKLKYWQKRRKSIQSPENIQIIDKVKKGKVFPRRPKSSFVSN